MDGLAVWPLLATIEDLGRATENIAELTRDVPLVISDTLDGVPIDQTRLLGAELILRHLLDPGLLEHHGKIDRRLVVESVIRTVGTIVSLDAGEGTGGRKFILGEDRRKLDLLGID